jgi:hypothetical protein
MKNFLLFFIFLFTISNGFCQETPSPTVTPPTAQELVKKMMDYRKAVKSGKVIVKVKWVKNSDVDYQGAEGTFRFYFKPNCMRKDNILQFTDGKSIIQYVKTPTHIFWCPGQGKNLPSRYMDEPKLLGYTFPSLYSPMLLGTSPVGIYAYEELDFNHRDLCPPQGENFYVVYDKINHIETWKVTYQIHHEKLDLKNSYWVVPQMGYSVIRFESEKSFSNGHKAVIHYTLKPKQYDDVWFPAEMHYQLEENGKITDEEIQTIEEAMFSQSIDNKSFALENLEIPQGTEVVVNGKFLKYWDGTKLSDFPSSPLPHKDQMTTQRRWKIFFIGNTILLLLLALHFYRRYLRIRNQQ